MLVLLKTSGCSKTKSCYKLLYYSWGHYFIASCKGNGESDDIEVIERYLLKKMTDEYKENHKNRPYC
jgi:hypothetical protein